MKKSQLQPGHIIECRNGYRAMLLPTGQFASNADVLYNRHMNEELIATSEAYAVVKVYLPTDDFIFNELQLSTTDNMSLVWERQEFEYPLYRLHPGSGLIVCFTDIKTGTVVVADVNGNYKVGYTSTNWLSHTHIWWEQANAPVSNSYEYPIFCELRVENSLLVVRFDSLQTGEVVASVNTKYDVGYTTDNWRPHTSTWTVITDPDTIAALTSRSVTPIKPTLEEICESLGITVIGDFDPDTKQHIADALLELFEE